MRKKTYWVRETHLFKADRYVCSACGAAVKKPLPQCTACGAKMAGEKVDNRWADEVEAMSALLDEDW